MLIRLACEAGSELLLKISLYKTSKHDLVNEDVHLLCLTGEDFRSQCLARSAQATSVHAPKFYLAQLCCDVSFLD